MLSDGMHEVGFSKSGSSIDKERIVYSGWIIRNSQSYCVGVFIVRPNDKIIKIELRIEIIFFFIRIGGIDGRGSNIYPFPFNDIFDFIF